MIRLCRHSQPITWFAIAGGMCGWFVFAHCSTHSLNKQVSDALVRDALREAFGEATPRGTVESLKRVGGGVINAVFRVRLQSKETVSRGV